MPDFQLSDEQLRQAAEEVAPQFEAFRAEAEANQAEREVSAPPPRNSASTVSSTSGCAPTRGSPRGFAAWMILFSKNNGNRLLPLFLFSNLLTSPTSPATPPGSSSSADWTSGTR